MNAILCGLSESEFVKAMHCESIKEIWDTLQNIFEDDDKLKKAKLQTHGGQFESLKMKDKQNVAAYLLRVDEIVNTIRGLGEKNEESMIVQKVLRSLPLRVDAKVFAIEEMKDLDNLTMDELHGILTVYEMRIEKENPSKREVVFKASKKMENREHKSSDSFDKESDAKEAHFLRKLKKGSRKYKVKLPSKCFNYGKVGHFAAKCPYVKTESCDDEEDNNIKENKSHQHKKNYKKGKHEKKKNFHKKKKSLYSKEDSSSFEESDECIFDSDREDILFMAINTKFDSIENEYQGKEKMNSKEVEIVETDGEVDLEEELIFALSEIKKLKKKDLKQKD